MSVKVINNRVRYSALRTDLVKQLGRLGDCVPIAVKSVYRFFGVNRQFTYKELIRAGFWDHPGRGSGVRDTDSFYKHKSLGLRLDAYKITNKADFIKQLKSARENNFPVILSQPRHAYTILPHTIERRKPSGRFDPETGKRLIKDEMINKEIAYFKFYLNKNTMPILIPEYYVSRGSKNLVVCFNSRYKDREKDVKDVAYSDASIDVEFVEIDSVWREFSKYRDMIYVIKGLNFGLEQLKTPRYEWGTTKSEYKKIRSPGRIEAKYWYRKYFDYFNGYLNKAFIYKIEEGDTDYEIIRKLEKSKEYYEIAAGKLKLLEKDCFSIYGIGEELRKEFNRNLPALIEEKRIIEYVKH